MFVLAYFMFHAKPIIQVNITPSVYVCYVVCIDYLLKSENCYFCPAAFWKNMSNQLYSEIRDLTIISWAIFWNTAQQYIILIQKDPY